MSEEYFIYNGRKFILEAEEPPINDTPMPVIPPLGTLKVEGDGRTFAVVEADEFFEDRSTNINQTNMIHPLRPVSTGLIGFIRSLFDFQVSQNGKHIINIGGSQWWSWFLDLLGWRNAELYATPGDGNMDTNDPNVNIFDPNAELKLMSAVYGTGKVEIVGEILQKGVWYDVIRTLDFHSPPVKGEDGVWRYKGEPINRNTHPPLFVTRVNRVKTGIITWLTRNGINAATDGGIEGGKGDEDWPLIAKSMVCLARRLLRRYEVPIELIVYKDSIIVDGKLIERHGGIRIVVDAIDFYGSGTWVRDRATHYWYKADEMLVRANVELRAPGNGFDYRCYVARVDKPREPWMGFMGFGSPRCGWMRKNL